MNERFEQHVNFNVYNNTFLIINFSYYIKFMDNSEEDINLWKFSIIDHRPRGLSSKVIFDNHKTKTSITSIPIYKDTIEEIINNYKVLESYNKNTITSMMKILNWGDINTGDIYDILNIINRRDIKQNKNSKTINETILQHLDFIQPIIEIQRKYNPDYSYEI